MSQVATFTRGSAWQILVRNKFSLLGVLILVLLLVIAVLGRALVPFDPAQVGAAPALVPPGPTYWMGTDELGRDVFSRVISGVRVSLIVGFGATIVSMVFGVLIGAIAGFVGGAVDDLLMRVTEIFMLIPGFFLALVLAALFGGNILNIIFILAVLNWPMAARIVRSEFLSLKSRQYVDAARVAGASSAALVFSEILPNALGPVIVTGTLGVGQAILAEAGLAYLGLGDPNAVSLGLLLQQAQGVMWVGWWVSVFPGAMIFLSVLSSNLLGDALNDIVNPRSRSR